MTSLQILFLGFAVGTLAMLVAVVGIAQQIIMQRTARRIREYLQERDEQAREAGIAVFNAQMKCLYEAHSRTTGDAR